MKKILLIFGLLISTFSFSAQGKWVNVVQISDENILIDTSRVKKVNKNIRVWVLHNHFSPKMNGHFSYKSVMEYQEVNCEEDKTKILRQTMFSDIMGEGLSLELNMNEKWNYNRPDTRFDVVLKFVCKLK